MKNKGRRGAERRGKIEGPEVNAGRLAFHYFPRHVLFVVPDSFLHSYLLELEELLLDLDPLRRRLVGLAPDELEHLVAAAADGPLRRMHHVGRGGHDVVVVARPLAHRAPHWSVVTHTMQWALRPTTDRSRKLEERGEGSLVSPSFSACSETSLGGVREADDDDQCCQVKSLQMAKMG